MNTKIIDAINNLNLIKLDYDGGERLIEPHCYGITTAGNHGLRVFQIDGYSSTGEMGWKMFDLSKASNIFILNEKFNSPRPGYKKNDKGMLKILAQL